MERAARVARRISHPCKDRSNTLSIIDVKANKVVDNLMVDLRPRAAVFSPNGKRLYVSAEIGGTISVIDITSRALLSTIAIDRGEGNLLASRSLPTVGIALMN